MSKVKFTIPNPCHEDWNKMSPNDKGRFCDACNKTVIDFSGMNQEEVINYFLQLKKESNQSICGHIKKSHLARPRTFHPLRVAAVGILLFSSTYLLQSCSNEPKTTPTEMKAAPAYDDDDIQMMVIDEVYPYEDLIDEGEIVEKGDIEQLIDKIGTNIEKPKRIPITCGEPVTPPMMLGQFMMPTDSITNQGEAPIEVQKED